MRMDAFVNRLTPKVVSELKENEVFVFGSNPNGHHKSGAAKLAGERDWAVEGKGEGIVWTKLCNTGA